MSLPDKRITIIGQGYVGLPLALAAASSGWEVWGIEIDTDRYSQLSLGSSPIEGVSDSVIESSLKSGNYKVENDFQVLSDSDIIVICVPTPLNEHGMPDLSALKSAVGSIDKYASKKALIINESTSHPGTLREIIAKRLEQYEGAERFEYAVAPERIDPGNSSFNVTNTPRIIGALSDEALRRASDFYKTFCSQVICVSSPEVAEFAKLLENSFRLVNISLVNEISKLTAELGVDVREVIDAATSKPFGFMPFKPGIGIGGHCIPIDPIYLAAYSRSKGVRQTLVESANRVDESMIPWIVEKIKSLFPDIHRITVVGIGYKSGSKDTRHSPSIRLIKALREQGYVADWIDSVVMRYDHEESSAGVESQLAIVVSMDEAFDADEYLNKGRRIMDFSGKIRMREGVFRF